jgi:hypothetical protein
MRIPRHPELQGHVNAEFLAGAKPTSKKSRPSSSKRYKDAVREAQMAIASTQAGTRDYSNLSYRAVVGLFVILHTQVYGVEPEDLLDGHAMDGAMSSARRLVDHEFAGRLDCALEYVRWTWRREKRQFPGRLSDWRITWRWQLASRTLMTDYRIAMSKTTAM